MEKYIQLKHGIKIVVINEEYIKTRISKNIYIICPYEEQWHMYMKATCLKIVPRLENPFKIFVKIYNTIILQKPKNSERGL